MNKKSVKINLIICLVIFLFPGNDKTVKSIYAKDIYRIGERMMFALKWNNIRIGVDIVELEGIVRIKSTDTYHIVSNTYTQGVVNALFKVKDRVETFIDTKTHLPLIYKKDINEGKYHKKEDYEFNQNNGTVKTSSGSYTTEKGVQDPLSILAYFRSLDIKIDDIINIKYFSGKETRNLRVKVERKEVIKTFMGKLNTNVVSFSVGKQERDYFKAKAKLWIWFTDDERKIPVFAKSKTSFGSVTGTLIDYVAGE